MSDEPAPPGPFAATPHEGARRAIFVDPAEFGSADPAVRDDTIPPPDALQVLADAGWLLVPTRAGHRDSSEPAGRLLLAAATQLFIDLKASWVIGDVLDDVEAGRRAGCRTVFVDQGNETAWRLSPWRIPHHSCGDLAQAAALILQSQPGLA